MSIFRKETSETGGRGEILRLGDAWKHVPGKPHDFDDWKPDEGNDDPAPLLRLFNECRRAEYQGNITQTDVGSFACVHCLGESKARERRKYAAEQSANNVTSLSRADNYVYEPLPDVSAIRILRVEPASTHDAPLRASLVVQLNRDTKRYVALSYTWSGIALCGKLDLGVGFLEITGNLDLALRSLRPTDTTLEIWADAVCIDQENPAEKGTQVARMNKTYAKAESVIAWLGPATANSSTALENLDILAELSKAPEYDEYTAPRPIALEDWLFAMDGDVATQIQELRKSTCINEVLERLWFTRLWVVQEVILAKDINLRIGKETICWQQFRRAVKMMFTADCQFISTSMETDIANDPIMYALTLVDMRDKMSSMMGGNMLMRDYTLQVFGKTLELRKWGCKNERDRVFAILGFIPKDSDMRFIPDYNADVRDIYINFARQHILHEGLMILLYAGLERRAGAGLLEYIKQSDKTRDKDDPDLDLLGLPSWIPDLRADRTSELDRYWTPMKFMAAMNRVPAAVLHTSCRHVLAVKGCVFDTISQILPVELTREGKTGVMDFLESMIYLGFVFRFAQEHYEGIGGYPSGEDFESVFNSVVTVGKTASKLTRLAQDREEGWIEGNLELLKRGSENNFQAIRDMLTENHDAILDIGLFFSSLSLLFLNYQCILTEDGYMGIAPTCSGHDKIAWINELQSFVVLRPVLDGQQYQLVGPCFLHGLMDGELLARGSDEDVCTFLELI